MSKDYLAEVSKEIINIKFETGKSLKSNINKFYKIMRKYGIKQGIETETGILSDNYEWIICWRLFISLFIDHLSLIDMITDIIPKDLRC